MSATPRMPSPVEFQAYDSDVGALITVLGLEKFEALQKRFGGLQDLDSQEWRPEPLRDLRVAQPLHRALAQGGSPGRGNRQAPWPFSKVRTALSAGSGPSSALSGRAK